ncbi:MAG: hypothetical protein U0414_11795 [Polyangiaceae bacterium]
MLPTAAGSAPASKSSIAEGLLGTLSWLVPFGVVLSRTSVAPAFDADLSNLRTLGLVSMGPAGGVSTAITQLVRWIPLGSLPFRTALASTFFLALTGRLLYGIALTFLRSVERERSSWFAPSLAAIAATLATVTPLFEAESTIGGGAIVAIACLFGAVFVSQRLFERRSEHIARDAVWVAVLLGCAVAEDIPCGVLGLLYLVCATWIAQKRARPFTVPDRAIRFAIGIFFFTVAALSAPAIVRALTPRTLVDFGPMASARLAGLVNPPANKGALAILVRDVGWIPLGLAAAGAVISLVTRRARRELAPLFLFAVLDGVFAAAMPERLVKMFSFATWDLAALGVLSIALATGLGAVVTRLDRITLSLRRPISVLVVAFHVMLVALVAEQAGDRADRGAHVAPALWTDAALGELEASSLVVVRSPLFEMRLASAQFIEGIRRDVVVVPISWLGRGSVASDAAFRERAVEPILRTVALTGTPDEFGLASLADVRHLYVEPDPAWDARMTAHLTPGVAWMKFSAEPLGSSDRDVVVDRMQGDWGRFVATAAPGAPSDPLSETAVLLTVRQQVAALVRASSLDAAGRVLSVARRSAGPDVADPLAQETRVAMKAAERIETATSTRPRAVPAPPAPRRVDHAPKKSARSPAHR